MKKVSTVAAKPSKKMSQQKLTVGLDLGDRNSWYCVLDESGQIQLEQRVRTNAKALREVFGEMPHQRIALEIGTHSPWISRLLSELGHELTLQMWVLSVIAIYRQSSAIFVTSPVAIGRQDCF
jgi:hypothetical protein